MLVERFVARTSVGRFDAGVLAWISRQQASRAESNSKPERDSNRSDGGIEMCERNLPTRGTSATPPCNISVTAALIHVRSINDQSLTF